MSKNQSPPLTRRHVFAGAGTAGALAAVAALLPTTPEAPPVQAGAVTGSGTEHGRYQVTQHVLRYYQTTRT